MRILLASNTYTPAANGQAVFTTNLARRLADDGHRVAVVFPSARGMGYHEIDHGIHMMGIKSVQLDFWHPDAYTILWADPTLKEFFSRFQPQIVHIQDHYPLSWSVIQLARQHDVPVVGTNHFVPENVAPYLPHVARFRPLFQWVLWHWVLHVFNHLDCVTVQSQTAANALRGAGLATPLLPVSCGIDVERFCIDPELDRQAVRRQFGLDPNKHIFLFVGRLDGEKRLDILLHALRLLDRSDVELAIAGRGTEFPRLQALCHNLGLERQVHFLGYILDGDLPNLLNSVDIFAMPSEAELLSIATLEAMGCGKPILAARARALPELVEEGVNGRLFHSGDPADAARAMAHLIEEAHLWTQMGTVSKHKTAAHTWTTVLKAYNAIYQSLVVQQSPSSDLISLPAPML